ncbi:hypothetical protein [Streptomyces zagrosensis]|uniref:Uncharacterized protein n=1 Tax=Streptomyces zagrosensis TaxID=1042984 RepID=A0A7W9UWS8_9ACTN|nr:hypothetical protein [Streptomyces zagrosensis]MBB5932984.1 hypothetical protein [Streptomyces zagrosensis]
MVVRVVGTVEWLVSQGPSAVTQFKVGELAAFGVGPEAGQPQPVEVGEAQLGHQPGPGA